MFLSVLVIYPLVMMLRQVQWNDLIVLINDIEFKEAAINSIKVTSVTTIISISLAYILAFTITQGNIRFRNQFSMIIMLPMLLPSISHGLSLVNIFGDNGFFSQYFNMNINLYGFKGIVMGSVIYTLPVAFLLLLDAMRYVDYNKYEIAEVLGIPKWRRSFVVIWPYMKKPVIVTFFAIATMVFTDYGVPLAVGGRFKTLATYLYTEVIGLLNFSKGALIGGILLIPALISFLIDIFIKDVRNNNLNRVKESVVTNKIRDFILKVILLSISGLIVMLIGSFVILLVATKYPYDLSFSLDHIRNVINKDALKYLLNAIWISISAAIIGSLLAYVVAYVTTRLEQSWLTKVLHIVAISSIAIPGIVLGLSYMMSFKGSFIYRTMYIIILANMVHFFASPYLMARNALKKLNVHYEDIGKTLKVSRFRIVVDVFIPNTIDTIIEMIIYFFINSMTTISAVTFLYSVKNMPISIMINQFTGALMFEEAATVSIMILVTNIIVKVVFTLIRKKCTPIYS